MLWVQGNCVVRYGEYEKRLKKLVSARVGYKIEVNKSCSWYAWVAARINVIRRHIPGDAGEGSIMNRRNFTVAYK
jgi:hypothetical protein